MDGKPTVSSPFLSASLETSCFTTMPHQLLKREFVVFEEIIVGECSWVAYTSSVMSLILWG